MEVYYVTILITIITSFLAKITVKYGKIEKNKTYNSLFIFITGIILIAVAGLRYKVGSDYVQYARNYTTYASDLWSSFSFFSEPGIRIIAKLSSLIYDDYATMFLISSIITVGLSVKTIAKYSTDFTFSILIYIFIGAWHASFNGVRQFLACSIIFAGHRYIIERKFKRYMLVVIVASLFHLSALGMIIFYFIPNKRLKFKEIIGLLIISLISIYSYDFLFNILETIKVQGLREQSYAMREINIVRIAISFSPLLLYYLMTLKSRIKVRENFYINMLFVNATLVLATSNSAYLNRFVIYTNIFSVIGITNLVDIKDKYLKIMLKSTIIICYALFWYFEVSSSSSLNEFQWIFNRN